MSLEVELEGHIYRIEKLDAFRQWHVFRRLIPLLSAFSGLANVDKNVVKLNMLSQLAPAFDQLQQMSDIDTDYVLCTCMEVVRRKEPSIPGGWSTVFNANAKRFMFDDIKMTTMLRLTTYVVVENLSDFFTQAASEDSTGAAQAESHSQQ